MNLELVFYGRVNGAAGTFKTAVGTGLGTIPNPLSNLQGSAVAANGGVGINTITFAQAMPIGEFLYEVGPIEGAARNSNAQVSVAGAVATINTSVAAVATDMDYWIKVSRVLAQS